MTAPTPSAPPRLHRDDVVPRGIVVWLEAARDASIRGGPQAVRATFALRIVAKIAADGLRTRREVAKRRSVPRQTVGGGA